ncbi:HPr family phosphocarrier protein [Bifidobacterium psychraerophilum]|jgi:phosphocarrier protein|uniref:Phosphocarrier protein HPr n=1 Tax=Bifidobacterium psychraerophilum TaxID=218140 RepID=A0A087CLZ7_9BIFI|nr:HPr family phosphocarrier protein [Bifidobacterium psychraerophilum]KFI84297.1 HPr family phosphocarrier protein [Bifidobacterium psychraerophilum]MCI1660813.1 HPr family phosphocarrier protein [Bifidobacterium psychraerophilum]MCI1804767.1 HPr family phosphocarrier protein [Bifidobacterium psychraerophilum]MCI2177313.1 HPr family phosphocarrier protein [Bifidobacterium psychraerophilum]MCI2182235.1 HPr family phosphocarrier protein [Bifidobacterium psychraerophilum]
MATATRTVHIEDPVGIHARPASAFTQAVAASGCSVTISKQPGTPGVDAASVLMVMSLGVQQHDTIEIVVEGDDAEAVADGLVKTLLASE